jgi:flagellar protein FliO/FliZ
MNARMEQPDSPSREPASERTIRIEFGRARLTGADAARIEPGSVIELDTKVSDDVEVFIDGRLRARGQAMLVKPHASHEADRITVAIGEVIQTASGGQAGQYRREERQSASVAKSLGLIVLAAALLAWPATSEADPASGPSPDHTNRPSQSGTDTKPVGGSDTKPIGGANGGDSSWIPTIQTLLALAVVIVLIYACRWLLRRLGKHGPIGGTDSGAVTVISRTPVGARQQLLLVRLGSRLVLVGSWPGGMAGLSEITDPAEVAAMTSSANKPGSTARAVADKIRRRLDGKESK